MTLGTQVISEFLGTAGLLLVVVGSGIMGESLAQGNAAIALLANSIATGAGLYALIRTFGHVSGAHFNPVVSLVEWRWKKLSSKALGFYCVAQLLGAVAGVLLAHLIFGLDLLQISSHSRAEFRLVISEVIATFGLIMVISLSGKKNVEATPAAVACYITSAYWFTSSTSFANPAVTIAREFTNTFAGIQPDGVIGFVAAQLVGGGLGLALSRIYNR